MIFQITRTSHMPSNETSPIEGAIKRTINRKQLDRKWSYDVWEYELETLNDLISLTASVGPCIVSDGKIEIYDDYRE